MQKIWNKSQKFPVYKRQCAAFDEQHVHRRNEKHQQRRVRLIENINSAVITFGRFNPPTIAHRQLFKTIRYQTGDGYVFVSHTQDNEKNPLSYDEKIAICKQSFPDITFGNPQVKTIIDAAKHVNDLGYENLIYVAGSDRVSEFQELLDRYNTKEYHFDNICVKCAGERTGSGKIQNTSATKLRKKVIENDYSGFSEHYMNSTDTREVFQILRERLCQ